MHMAAPDAALRPGEAFAVTLEVPEAGGPFMVVILYAPPGAGWRVVLPDGPDDVLPLGALDARGGGHRLLELMTGPEAGRQRWAVLLAPLDAPVDWSMAPIERWAALRADLTGGRLPSASWSVEVAVAV